MGRERTTLPEEEVKRLADLGFLGIALPEEYGGQGGTLLDALIVIEELAKECRPAAFQVFEANTGPVRVHRVLRHRGAEAARTCPRSSPGEITMAVGDLRAGRRLRRHRHEARRHVATATSIVINGSKRWISNGGHADHYLVYCRLNDEPGAKGIGASSSPPTRPGSASARRSG